MQLPPWIRNVGIALAVVWLGHRLLVDVLIDWLWFDAIGYASVFKTSLTAEVLCWAGGFITAVIALGFNLRVAIQRAPLNLMGLGILMQQASLPADRIRGIVRLGIGAAIALPAFMISGGAGQQWLDVLALLHRQSFGVVEPVFGLDASFYVFILPVIRFGRGLLMGLVTLGVLQALAWYVLHAVTRGRERPELSSRARGHLLVLGSLGDGR